ncbi:hypothetical protein QCA50_003741 [Cerrena zonata]|uniref:Uncharacterized protein n=1 Tax=Cerrena zonata TaxID=2478898 RepID=A0AAW0GHF6_9APHY
MSARQNNKKRKGRNNVLNRERTVTTLTEGPEGTFLIPTPTDEPAPSIMSAPFTNPAGTMNPSFSLASGFAPFQAYSQSFIPTPMAGPPYPQQQFFPQQQPSGLPGQSDLELLEKIKDTIKSNQHELFRPVPHPAALVGLYKNPHVLHSALSQVPPHPEQIPEYASLGDSSGNNGATSMGEARHLRAHGSDSWKQGPDTGNSSGVGLQRYDSGSSMPRPNDMDMDASVPPGLSTQPNSPTTLQRQRSHSQSQLLAHKSTDSIEVKKEEIVTRLGDRDNNWDRRPGSLEDLKYNDQARNGGRPDTRYNTNNRGRFYDRDRDVHRDRDREREVNWDRDRDLNRDRGGPVGRMNCRDLDRDRRNDDRDRFDNRRPAGEQRHYEPLKRHDSRTSVIGPSESPTTATRPDDSRDRDRPVPPGDARPPRPLGEERSLGSFRPPDDRDRRPPPLHDDRRPPPDDRRPLPGDRRGPPPPLDRERDRPSKPVDDRQPPPISERRPLPSDDHRRSPVPGNNGYNADRQARPLPSDDHRPPRASSPPADRVRPVGPPSTGRGPPPIIEDRRQPPTPSIPSTASDRGRPPIDDRVAPRSTVPATVPPNDGRPPISDRPLERNARPHVPLEDRIGRPLPTLQERLSGGPEQPPAARSEARPPVTESRPPVGSGSESTIRVVDTRPPPSGTGPPAESSRPTTSASGTEERGRPSDRFPRPAPPIQADRDRTRSGPAPPYVAARAPSVAREDNRPFKRAPTVSPSRRYDAPRSGFANRPPPGDYDRDRRTDSTMMDVDPPTSRYGGGDRPPPAVYRRSSPAPYADRNWPPAAPETYTADTRRPPPADLHSTYPREWRDDERGHPTDDYERRTWDRDRERDRDYDRDARIPERDPLPPVSSGPTSTWDRDRRPYPPPPVDTTAPPARPYDQRPLSARLTDGYPPTDDRDRDIERDRPPYSRDYDRTRYPPGGVEAPATYSRVRPRSPSPAGSVRVPPLKRMREEGYPPGYYSPTHSGTMDVTPDYPPHNRTRTPPVPAGYYDDPRGPGYNVGSTTGGVPPRERDYPDARDTFAYDRRAVDTRAPPARRTPPAYGRPYDRDDRRYPPRP